MSIPTADDLVLYEQQEQKTIYPFRYAYVVGKFANGAAKITFEGEDAASEKQYAYLASYKPAIGDRVILAPTADTYIILGKVKFNAAPDAAESTFVTLTTSGKATLNSLEVTNDADLKKDLIVRGQFQHLGGYLGFFNTQATTKKNCTNIAPSATLTTAVSKINEIIDALQAYGLFGY